MTALSLATFVLAIALYGVLRRYRTRAAARARRSPSICLWRIDEHGELTHIMVRAPEQPRAAGLRDEFDIPPFLRPDPEATKDDVSR